MVWILFYILTPTECVSPGIFSCCSCSCYTIICPDKEYAGMCLFIITVKPESCQTPFHAGSLKHWAQHGFCFNSFQKMAYKLLFSTNPFFFFICWYSFCIWNSLAMTSFFFSVSVVSSWVIFLSVLTSQKKNLYTVFEVWVLNACVKELTFQKCFFLLGKEELACSTLTYSFYV